MKWAKEDKLRREGLTYALKIMEEKGEDGLRREVAMRGATEMPLAVPTDVVNECIERIKATTIDTITILTLVTLLDEFGFKAKRLQRFMNRFDLKTSVLVEDYATWKDMQQILADEVGIHLEIRDNSRDIVIR